MRVRIGDVVVAPAGEGLALVYSRDAGAALLLTPDIVRLLLSATRFRTVEEHVDAFARGPSVGAPRLRAQLERLARAGFLVTDASAAEGEDTDPPPPIATLAFPTCDRLRTLPATVMSYVANARRAGRSVDVLVADDSNRPRNRSGDDAASPRYVRRAADRLADDRRHRPPAAFAGPPARRRPLDMPGGERWRACREHVSVPPMSRRKRGAGCDCGKLHRAACRTGR